MLYQYSRAYNRLGLALTHMDNVMWNLKIFCPSGVDNIVAIVYFWSNLQFFGRYDIVILR